MIRPIATGLFLCMSAVELLAAGTTPKDFEAYADVVGTFDPHVPVRVPLMPEILARARPNFGDVRLFDSRGQETPYVIYVQATTKRVPTSFEFELLSYRQTDGAEELTLKRPERESSFYQVELKVVGADFNKRIEVAVGASLGTLKVVAVDVIFDFSSRVNLRKTHVRFPATDAHFVRLTMTDINKVDRQDPEVTLRYEGLEFWTAGARPGPFRVSTVRGWAGESRSAEHYYDTVTISQPSSRLDDAGNTVVYLDAKLPVAQIALELGNSYYYRRVQVLTSPDGVEPYRVAGAGVVYKVPGMPESMNTIRIQRTASHLRLKVLNEDNPPLDIQGVEIAWIRRNLYFVPEPDRSYELYVGNDAVRSPRYELASLIPSDHLKLAGYGELALTSLHRNPVYKPSTPPATRDGLEKTILVVVVVILVCALSIWAFRLLKNVPRETSE